MHRLDAHQPRTSSTLTLLPGDTITQTFLSNYNNLDIVSICLRNQDRLLQPLTFTLSNQQGEILRTIPISTGNIDNQDCTKFQFDPITNSADNTFSATITVATGSSVAAPGTQPITVEAYTGTDYPQGIALKNMVDTNLDLHFKTFYSQAYSSVIAESLAQILPRFGRDWVFSIFWTLAVGYLIFRLIKRPR